MSKNTSIDTVVTPPAVQRAGQINTSDEDQTLLRRPEVEKLTGKRRSSIYSDIQKGLFPAPVKIGARAVAWRRKHVLDWIAMRKSVSS